jgi:hypothetical protein
MATTRVVPVVAAERVQISRSTGFGLHMDSTEPVSYNLAVHANGCKCLKQGRLEVVARDGIEPPPPAFSGLLTDARKVLGISGSV